jgi:hypothetical protein
VFVNGKSLMENAGLLTDVRVKVRDWVSACLLVAKVWASHLYRISPAGELRGLCVVPLTLPCIVSLDWFVRHPETLLLRRRRYSTAGKM